MQNLAKKCLVYLVCITLVQLSIPRGARGGGGFPRGHDSADKAAAARPEQLSNGHTLSDGWQYAFASADTTDYEFPEEEEKRNLVREVAMYVVIAGFVAFFIIKVFLEGDTDLPPSDNGGGKENPDS